MLNRPPTLRSAPLPLSLSLCLSYTVITYDTRTRWPIRWPRTSTSPCHAPFCRWLEALAMTIWLQATPNWFRFRSRVAIQLNEYECEYECECQCECKCVFIYECLNGLAPFIKLSHTLFLPHSPAVCAWVLGQACVNGPQDKRDLANWLIHLAYCQNMLLKLYLRVHT